MYKVPLLEISAANTVTTSRFTENVNSPLAFAVLAHLTVSLDDASAFAGRICCPDETDAAPSLTASPLTNLRQPSAGNSTTITINIRTSATGTIAARLVSGTADSFLVQLDGFTWSRRL